jgi:hypothetical protein
MRTHIQQFENTRIGVSVYLQYEEDMVRRAEAYARQVFEAER